MKEESLYCPYCNSLTIKTKKNLKNMEMYGRAIIICDACDNLFMLRDDGDGEYIYGKK